MMAVSVFLAIFLGALAGLHVFWAFGGSRGSAVAVPEREGRPLFVPSRTAALAVALGLTLAAACALSRAGVLIVPGTQLAAKIGCGVLGILFVARAVGEGRYVGIFKRVRTTAFARWDTWLYSPLCLALSLGFLVLCAGLDP